MADAIHTMRAVSKRTGLSPHVIRVWERRYGAVKPTRTPTNRRVYRDEDIERLELLHRATEAGHAISQACKLSNEDLRDILKKSSTRALVTQKPADVIDHDWGAELTNRAMDAVESLDAKALEDTFKEAVMDLGTQGLLVQVAAPMTQRVGDLWKEGTLNSTHEHFLSAALRTFLGRHTQQFSVPPSAPVVLVTTPAGQIHELGAVIVSAAAANLGWKVIYLGTNLPAAEIAGLAKRKAARAVALSIVYPTDDPELPRELHQLREYLPEDVEIIVGGRGASSYATALVEIGARIANKLEDLFPALEAARKPAKKNLS